MKPDHADEVIAAWRAELPDIAGLGLELAKRTARLASMLDAATAEQLAKLDITKAEYEVLATLRRVGAPYRLTPTELTSSLLITSGGASNVIRRLTEARYVTRTSNAADGRSSWVQLTDLGVAFAERAVRNTVRAHDRLVAQLPKRTANQLSALLRDALVALGDDASDEFTSTAS